MALKDYLDGTVTVGETAEINDVNSSEQRCDVELYLDRLQKITSSPDVSLIDKAAINLASLGLYCKNWFGVELSQNGLYAIVEKRADVVKKEAPSLSDEDINKLIRVYSHVSEFEPNETTFYNSSIDVTADSFFQNTVRDMARHTGMLIFVRKSKDWEWETIASEIKVSADFLIERMSSINKR